MHEDVHLFKQYVQPQKAANVLMAGISYGDQSYRIERLNYDNYVIEYTIDGEGTLEVNSEAYCLKSGTLHFLYKGQGHKYYCSGERWNKIWVVLYGEIVESLFQIYLKHQPSIIECPEAEPLMRSIFEIAQNQANGYDELADEILIYVHKVLLLVQKKIIEPPITSSLAEKIKAHIDANLHKPLRLDELSIRMHYSKNHIINVFRNHYHITPYTYYEKQRISAAAELLKNTSLTVDSIAKEYGFENSQCFSKSFKKHFSLSPLHYRKKYAFKDSEKNIG